MMIVPGLYEEELEENRGIQQTKGPLVLGPCIQPVHNPRHHLMVFSMYFSILKARPLKPT